MKRRAGERPVGLNLLGQPELSEQLMRALELKGDLPQLLDPIFSLTVQVLDLMDPEFQHLRRTRRFMAGNDIGPVAGQFPYLVFARNGQTRDQIAVVERISVTNLNAAPLRCWIYLLQNGAAPGVGTQATPTDDRTPLAAAAGHTIGIATSITSFVTPARLTVNIPQDQTVFVPGPWIITTAGPVGAQTQLVVQGATVNQAFDVSVFWRERLLLSTEL